MSNFGGEAKESGESYCALYLTGKCTFIAGEKTAAPELMFPKPGKGISSGMRHTGLPVCLASLRAITPEAIAHIQKKDCPTGYRKGEAVPSIDSLGKFSKGQFLLNTLLDKNPVNLTDQSETDVTDFTSWKKGIRRAADSRFLLYPQRRLLGDPSYGKLSEADQRRLMESLYPSSNSLQGPQSDRRWTGYKPFSRWDAYTAGEEASGTSAMKDSIDWRQIEQQPLTNRVSLNEPILTGLSSLNKTPEQRMKEGIGFTPEELSQLGRTWGVDGVIKILDAVNVIAKVELDVFFKGVEQRMIKYHGSKFYLKENPEDKR